MKLNSISALYLCVFAPAAAQLGLSLPPALQSLAGAIQSLADPSDTPAPAPAPSPTKQTTKATPEPQTTAAPPLQATPTPSSTSIETTPTFTTSIVSTSSTSESTTSSTSSSSSSSSSASTTSHTTNTLAEAAATSTPTDASNSSTGLSHDAKVGIGVGIGVFVLVGLLAAALFSFLKDRHTSEAYERWRENRRNKHSRLGSSATNTSFRGREKEMELNRVEYGNGTVLGGGRPAMPTVYETPTPTTETKDLPAPPVAYQQAKQVQIKRKAVPGQAKLQTQRPRFSWMD